MPRPWQELRLSAVVVRVDFILITVGVALLLRPTLGLGLAAAIGLHELGHGVAEAAVGRPFRWLLQVGGGAAYLSDAPTARAEAVILAAGSVGSAIAAGLGFVLARTMGVSELAYFGADLAFCGLLWTGFQLLPFPPLDGGLLLRRVLTSKGFGATGAWRIGWICGLLAVVAVVAIDLSFLEPMVWLTAMTVLLGRSEAGHVRHVDAYSAWNRGDLRGVIERVSSAPESLPKADRHRLLELGIEAALELEAIAELERFAGQLPPQHRAVIRTAEWLLRRQRGYGARLAEYAYDALASERVKLEEIDKDRWADLMLHHAFFEAAELRDDSALGLLERAVEMGFDHFDRLEAEPRLDRLRGHPRYRALLSRGQK